MAPTNIKTVHQTSFTPYREQPRSTRIVVAYPRRPAFSATNRTNTFQPVLINNSKFLKATHRTGTKIRKIEIPRSMVVEALTELVKPAREPASSRPNKALCILKKPHESCPFAAPSGPHSRKKNDRGHRSAFPSETSRFALSILAHRGSALPWLVNDRAALCLRRICQLLLYIPGIPCILNNCNSCTILLHYAPIESISGSTDYCLKKNQSCLKKNQNAPRPSEFLLHEVPDCTYSEGQCCHTVPCACSPPIYIYYMYIIIIIIIISAH